MRRLVLAASFVLALLSTWMAVPALAFAQEAVAKSPAGARLLDQIVEIVAYAVGLVLTALIGKLIMAFEQKTKIDVPDAGEKMITGLIDKGIAYAEEQGHKAVKKNAKKLEMGESLDAAADFVLDLAESKKVKQMSKDKLKKLIESRLATKRNGAVDKP